MGSRKGYIGMDKLKQIENDLVPVYETDTGEKVVYGTELFDKLDSKRQYTDWIKGRLSECEAVEGEDYQSFSQKNEKPQGGRPGQEYIIRLDTAKEMAMLERSEIGKQVRKYFIQVERRYKQQRIDRSQLSPEAQLMNLLVENISRQELEQKRQAETLEQLREQNQKTAEQVQSIREVVAVSAKSWREETGKILKRIAMESGGGTAYSQIRAESYELLGKRMAVDLKRRLVNKRRRMAEEGISKSARDKLSYVDVIAEDKKLVEGYIAIVKEMAVKYGI